MTLKEQIFADVLRLQYERALLSPDFNRFPDSTLSAAIEHALRVSEEAAQAFDKAETERIRAYGERLSARAVLPAP